MTKQQVRALLERWLVLYDDDIDFRSFGIYMKAGKAFRAKVSFSQGVDKQ